MCLLLHSTTCHDTHPMLRTHIVSVEMALPTKSPRRWHFNANTGETESQEESQAQGLHPTHPPTAQADLFARLGTEQSTTDLRCTTNAPKHAM